MHQLLRYSIYLKFGHGFWAYSLTFFLLFCSLVKDALKGGRASTHSTNKRRSRTVPDMNTKEIGLPQEWTYWRAVSTSHAMPKYSSPPPILLVSRSLSDVIVCLGILFVKKKKKKKSKKRIKKKMTDRRSSES